MYEPEDQVPVRDYSFDIQGGSGIYDLEWPHMNISASVSRVKADSNHELRAEVWVQSARPLSSGHMGQGRLILTSPANRKTFAKSLADRDPEVDWDKVIEQLSVAVLEEYRVGVPAVQISGNVLKTVDTNQRWLVEPLIQYGHPTLLYGKGSSGKSWMAQYLSVLIHEGLSLSGLTVDEATVLYLDWETDQNEITSRIAMIRQGLGLPLDTASGIWYKSMTQGLSADIATVMTLVQEHNIHFVVLDSLGSACMGEPESAEVVLRMFMALGSLGVTSLCIDHTNKEGSLFGSVYKFNNSRQIFEAKKAQGEGDTELEFALFHKKANNSKLIKPMGWVLKFDGEAHATTLVRRDVKDTRLESEMTVVDRIKNLLTINPSGMRPNEIAIELDKTSSHISKELSTHNQLFEKMDSGLWTLRMTEDTIIDTEF